MNFLLNPLAKPLISIVLFVVSMVLGYKIIKNVPSLLHTPLMSGMNALSGVTIIGALVVFSQDLGTRGKIFGFIAIVLATFNVVGGFKVTDRMLKMFSNK
ncbi:NAD(P) transhydrogenase subunit alpha [Anaerococcus sp. AGMB09787]|uniref:NAD(P) transhydrogenase subunit alpha n=1 Tax=Anaerococcus sp. AGMB09787 TaxID=2922869 RepID=UPI001FAF2B5E|nr:NAD(P) transhydrogenase subunit alpha [Anaerococcus sp. AGMB09787]